MAKNIFISNLPLNTVREMVTIWWQFGEIESFIYIKNKNIVIIIICFIEIRSNFLKYCRQLFVLLN